MRVMSPLDEPSACDRRWPRHPAVRRRTDSAHSPRAAALQLRLSPKETLQHLWGSRHKQGSQRRVREGGTNEAACKSTQSTARATNTRAPLQAHAVRNSGGKQRQRIRKQDVIEAKVLTSQRALTVMK